MVANKILCFENNVVNFYQPKILSLVCLIANYKWNKRISLKEKLVGFSPLRSDNGEATYHRLEDFFYFSLDNYRRLYHPYEFPKKPKEEPLPGERGFTCKYCDKKGFKIVSSRNAHQRRHESDRWVKCPDCSWRSRNKSDLWVS